MINWFAYTVTLILLWIPSVFITTALLAGTNLRRFDKILISITLSLVLVPFLTFLEFFAFGLKLSTPLIFANIAILTILGIAGCLYQKKNLLNTAKNAVSYARGLNFESFKKNLGFYLVPVALLVIIAISFYTKLIPLSAKFFEFDPYFYTLLTDLLLRNGFSPLTLDISYYPVGEVFRYQPIVTYMQATWFMLHQLFTSAAYDQNTLILIANTYPPLVGALLSVAAFWFVREEYDEYAGLIAAGFIAFTPQIVQKFAAGVAELQPWGILTAILAFALYAMAAKRESLRLAALGAFVMVVSVLGGQQYIWPFAVMAAYFGISAFLAFIKGNLNQRKVLIDSTFAIAGFAGGLLLSAYIPTLETPIISIILLASILPSVALLFISKNAIFSKFNKLHLVAGILIAAFIVSILPVLPAGQSILSTFSGYANIARNLAPLGNTIAEENPTFEGVFASAFGVLSPYLIFNILALAFAIWAYYALFQSKKFKAAGALTLLILGTFALPMAAGVFNFPQSIQSIITSQVAASLVIALISFIFFYYYSKDESHANLTLISILSILIVFPVAFIGLNKIKFILHLAIVLALAAPIAIAEYARILQALSNKFKLVKAGSQNRSTQITSVVIAFTLLIGGLAVIVQATGIQGKHAPVLATVEGLKGSTISDDWLLAMQWLKNNTSYLNPEADSACKAKFGYSCRVMSWWDYGHWTMFLGGTKTVLDPTNTRSYFNHQVAHSFVDDAQDLKYAMDYHQATHVLVDFQLIQKWGALVYLSGTCQRSNASYIPVELPACPLKAAILDWQGGAGKSEYELMHYFEQISLTGQQCPFASGLALAKSSFGLAYCASQTQLIPIDSSGLRSDLARDLKIVELTSKTPLEINNNTAYLLPIAQNTLINANPDFRIVNKTNEVLKSAYARLYFFNNLPGYKLVYSSPRGEVKIFEYVK